MEPHAPAEYLAETISWHLWPKMISHADAPPAMRFSVRCNGIAHPVPDPRETRPLSLFVAAYEKMASQEGSDVACRNPKRHLGRLGLVKRIMPAMVPTHASRMLGIEDLVHHVCLMRPAELVVTYFAGPKPPSENLGYAGVFRADEAMDEVYAKAEPPTHDAWNPQSLERPESTFVHVTFRRITEASEGLVSLGGVARSGSSNVALGAASSLFSGLVGGAWGIGGDTAYSKPGSTITRSKRADPEEDGPDSSPGPRAGAGGASRVRGESDTGEASPYQGNTAHGPSSTPRRRPRVQYLGEPYFDERGDDAVLVQEFLLPVPGSQRVRIELAVTLPGTGGRETDPPVGASMPTLIGWESPDGTVDASEACVIEGGESLWRALVRPAPDTMTEIAVKVEAVQAP
jgi:hypothetical protein